MDFMKKLTGVVVVLFLVCLVFTSTPPEAVSFDKGEAQLIYDGGTFRVFALPESDGSAKAYDQAEVGPAAAKAKVKIMTCHATNPPLVFWDTFPWIKIGEEMAHYVLYEVQGATDEVNIIFTITGPQFKDRHVEKSGWLIHNPGKYYYEWIGTGFYTVEGYYKMTVQAIPKGNKLKGASKDTTWFRIEPAPPAP